MAMHLKTIPGSKVTQIVYGKSLHEHFCAIQTLSGKSSHKHFRIRKFRIHNLSVIILYRIHVSLWRFYAVKTTGMYTINMKQMDSVL